jgi:dihydroflavonol-4-reductase
MILVTGATGLVGTYLLYELTLKGKHVRALIRPGHDKNDQTNLFRYFDGHPETLYSQIEWIEGDVLDIHSLEAAMSGITQVYHCAALISFNPKDRVSMQRINIEGTSNIVNSCLRNKVQKLVHVSSISALGGSVKNTLKDEEMNWKTSRKNSGYAISKFGGEREVWRGIEEGLNAVIVNPSVILGAGCHPAAVNPIFKAFKHLLPFYIDGATGYVDVRDVARAMILLMESDVTGERFLLNSENLKQRELFNLAAGLLGRRKPFIPVNRSLLGVIWMEEKLRSVLTGSTPLITRENARASMGSTYYSSEKFRKRFSFEFIPVKESLEFAFGILKKAMESLIKDKKGFHIE